MLGCTAVSMPDYDAARGRIWTSKNTKGVIKWKYVPKDTIVKTIDFIDNDLLD